MAFAMMKINVLYLRDIAENLFALEDFQGTKMTEWPLSNNLGWFLWAQKEQIHIGTIIVEAASYHLIMSWLQLIVCHNPLE